MLSQQAMRQTNSKSANKAVCALDCIGTPALAFGCSAALRFITIQMEKKRCYDSFGRTLAYVFLQDGTWVNEVLLKEGFPTLTAGIIGKHYQSFNR